MAHRRQRKYLHARWRENWCTVVMHRVSSKLLVFVIQKSIVRMFTVFTQPISIECVLWSTRNHPGAFFKSGYLIHLQNHNITGSDRMKPYQLYIYGYLSNKMNSWRHVGVVGWLCEGNISPNGHAAPWMLPQRCNFVVITLIVEAFTKYTYSSHTHKLHQKKHKLLPQPALGCRFYSLCLCVVFVVQCVNFFF